MLALIVFSIFATAVLGIDCSCQKACPFGSSCCGHTCDFLGFLGGDCSCEDDVELMKAEETALAGIECSCQKSCPFGSSCCGHTCDFLGFLGGDCSCEDDVELMKAQEAEAKVAEIKMQRVPEKETEVAGWSCSCQKDCPWLSSCCGHTCYFAGSFGDCTCENDVELMKAQEEEAKLAEIKMQRVPEKAEETALAGIECSCQRACPWLSSCCGHTCYFAGSFGNCECENDAEAMTGETVLMTTPSSKGPSAFTYVLAAFGFSAVAYGAYKHYKN